MYLPFSWNMSYQLFYFARKKYWKHLISSLMRLWLHCTKNYIFFFKCSEKMIFPKKSHWNIIFLVSSGKLIFLFPENMILFFRRKMKDDLSQKNTLKYHIFFKCSEKMVFPKKLHWNMIFLTSWGRMAFLFPENMIFFLTDRE